MKKGGIPQVQGTVDFYCGKALEIDPQFSGITPSKAKDKVKQDPLGFGKRLTVCRAKCVELAVETEGKVTATFSE